MSTLTWLHLSDIHLRDATAYNAKVVLDALLEDLRRPAVPGNPRPDLILFSGDLAHAGSTADYTYVAQFFDRLLEVTGLSRDRLLIIPGNHDVDRAAITPEAALKSAELTTRDVVTNALGSAADRALLLRRLQGYADFVNTYFAGVLECDSDRYYYVRRLEIAGVKVAILALNSAWQCSGDADRNNLIVGERQVREALEKATDARLKIAMLHHPFDWLKDFDRKDVSALLRRHCQFILRGHLHETDIALHISPDSGSMEIAAGSGFDTREYVGNAYNVVQLDLEKGKGTVYLRRYSDNQGGFWAKDTLTYRNVPDGTYSFELPSSLTLPAVLGSDTGAIVTTPARGPVVPAYDRRVMMELINEAFDAGEFEDFVFAWFPIVDRNFTSGMGMSMRIRNLISYAERHREMPHLLEGIRKSNPTVYEEFEARLPGS